MLRKSYQVKKDDRIIVLSGKEKGKIGKVLKVIPKNDRIVIEKVNMLKRHTKAGPNVAKGGIIGPDTGRQPDVGRRRACPDM
jgi:large subunit ribosomal protein L24